MTRREDRRIAIDILYQADVTDAAPTGVVETGVRQVVRCHRFATALIDGVTERQPDIDLLLETHAEGWTVARMTALDRTILRVGVYELLWDDDVPPSVAISEAVEAAAELSAEDAKRFVNGVLGRIAREEGSRALVRRSAAPVRLRLLRRPAGSLAGVAAVGSAGVGGGRRPAPRRRRLPSGPS